MLIHQLADIAARAERGRIADSRGALVGQSPVEGAVTRESCIGLGARRLPGAAGQRVTPYEDRLLLTRPSSP